jgi:GGDEF domain-containing protein
MAREGRFLGRRAGHLGVVRAPGPARAPLPVPGRHRLRLPDPGGRLPDRVADRRRLEHQAFHDGLTGLPNRALFRERVAHALRRRSQAGTPLALRFIDLDDFKTVNDQLGHAAGDDLLVEVAGRLKTCVRGEDTVARLGGDEFAIGKGRYELASSSA